MKNLHRYSLAASLALGVAVLGACAEEPREDEEFDMPEVEEPASVDTYSMERPAAAQGNVVMTASFEPGEGGPQGPIGGTIDVLEGAEPGGSYRLALRIEGLPPGEHAWHIHSAPCGQEAPVVVPLTETPESPGLAEPLTAGVDGSAEANVTVPADLLPLEQLKGGEYSLHVHERGGLDHGPTMACANL